MSSTTTASPLLIVAAAALLDGEGRVLVQKRPPGKSMAGLWEFPGGKIERCESPEAALVRELREELGIDVKAASLAPAIFASEPLDGHHLVMLVYLCRFWKGTPQSLHASALQWAKPVDLHTLPMPPADRPLIVLLEALI